MLEVGSGNGEALLGIILGIVIVFDNLPFILYIVFKGLLL